MQGFESKPIPGILDTPRPPPATVTPMRDYTAAFDAMTNALDTLATRCGTVGSSAFQ